MGGRYAASREMTGVLAEDIGDLAYTREHASAELTVRDVAALFEHTPDLDSVAVVEPDGRFGLVVRSHLTNELGRQFGYALYARRPIRVLTEWDVLHFDVRQDPVIVIAEAVHRDLHRIYDDILLTKNGCYFGLVSMRLLMAHSKNLLIRSMGEVGELEQRNRSLDEMNRMQREFVANMTHELRAPLSTMLGVANLLAGDDAIPEARRRDVGMLLSRGQDLLGIVNNFLEMHRIEAGEVEPFFEQVELEPLLDDCLDAASYLVGGRPIAILRDYQELPRHLLTDAVLVRRIFTNLLSNAIKFTDRGTVTLAGRWLGSTLALSVRDTGLGIRAEDHARLFQKFAQLERTKTKRHAGTGLGLAIVKNLTQLLGGSIAVNSQPGVGSEFTVTLPASASARVAQLAI